MCTAISFKTKDHYFGRNLDLEFSYGGEVTVMPRNYEFPYRRVKTPQRQYAIIGMAKIVAGVPLFFDGTNEEGLSMAALNFPGNAVYYPEEAEKENVTPFELIPWILGQCATVREAKNVLGRINLVAIPFSTEYPLSPLHWMISDRDESIVVESLKEGLQIYDNPVGVLTNNPPFPMQLFGLNDYMGLSAEPAENCFAPKLPLYAYSRGMGGAGLPGDLSSKSRFVRGVFTKYNSVCGESESESLSQFFHILGAVEQQRGCVRPETGGYEITVYSSCCNTDKGIYYYTTYENRQITGVDLHQEDLDGRCVIGYPRVKGQQIRMQNSK